MTRRALLVAAYVMLAACGAASMVWPSPSVEASGRTWAFVWSAMLVVGGVPAALGAARNRWVGEWVGLPPLVAVWAVYGIAAAAMGLRTGTPARIAPALALLAVAAVLFWRWQNVALDRDAARAAARESRRRSTCG